MTCISCGANLPVDAMFCGECGRAMRIGSASIVRRPAAPLWESVAEPVSEPVSGSVIASDMGSVVAPFVAPFVEPVAGSVVEPVAGSVAKRGAEPVGIGTLARQNDTVSLDREWLSASFESAAVLRPERVPLPPAIVPFRGQASSPVSAPPSSSTSSSTSTDASTSTSTSRWTSHGTPSHLAFSRPESDNRVVGSWGDDLEDSHDVYGLRTVEEREALDAVDELDDLDDLERTRIMPRRQRGARFVLQFSTGENVMVFGTGLVGRHPTPQPDELFDQLVTISDPSRSVSKTHLEFGQEGGAFWISDRFSGNGSVVREPESPPRRCDAAKRYRIVRGTRVDMGEQFVIVS